ncbi:MAG: hypothetical protein JKY09_00520 [Crocinitomicaceae bacterium]|nr:hypothetical protein [Crocinitomicaceae bacterium]
MKYILYILLIGFILIGCEKEKLEGNSRILEGKWKWISSHERNWNFETDTYDHTIHPSSNYSDEYFLEFEHKGKVKFMKNNKIEKNYRTVFNRFELGCTSLSTDCYRYHILLDNNKKNTLTGGMNKDTIVCNDTNLPLEWQSETLTYSHTYIRVN